MRFKYICTLSSAIYIYMQFSSIFSREYRHGGLGNMLQHNKKWQSISISISFVIGLLSFKLTYFHLSQQQTIRLKRNPCILYENTPRLFKPFSLKPYFNVILYVRCLRCIFTSPPCGLSAPSVFTTTLLPHFTRRHLCKAHKPWKYFFKTSKAFP